MSNSLYENSLSVLANEVFIYGMYGTFPIAVISNVLTILVYSSKQLRVHSMSIYYCAKAVVDILVYAILLAWNHQVSFVSSSISNGSCIFYITLVPVCQSLSSFYMIYATLDRVRLIVYPSRLKFTVKRWFGLLLTLGSIIIFICVYIPRGLSTAKHLTRPACAVKDVLVYNAYGWAHLAIYAFFPSIVTITSTTHILMKVRASKRRVNPILSSNNTSNIATKFTKNVLAMNILLFSSRLLHGCMNAAYTSIILINVKVYYDHFGKLVMALQTVMLFTNILNSCLPFFIHLATNKIFFEITREKFRRVLRFKEQVTTLQQKTKTFI